MLFCIRFLQLSVALRRVLGRSKYGKLRGVEILPFPTNRWLDPFFAISEPVEGISDYVKAEIPKAMETFRKEYHLPDTEGMFCSDF